MTLHVQDDGLIDDSNPIFMHIGIRRIIQQVAVSVAAADLIISFQINVKDVHLMYGCEC